MLYLLFKVLLLMCIGAIAAFIFILTEIGAKFDVELFSLLAMNAVVPLLNKLSVKRGGVA